MASESYKERQDDELQALHAIFMSDFKDLRQKDAWKVNRPPHVSLTLKPQESFGHHGQETYVQLDLIFKCPQTYPDVVPEITLENTKGLSNQQLAELKTELDKKSKELRGEEMMLELSQLVQTYLYAHNKPPPKSFYEEMMSNKRRQQEIEDQEQQRKMELLRQKEERELLMIEDEIQKRQEALKEENRRQKSNARQPSLEKQSAPMPRRSSSPIAAISNTKQGTPSQSPTARKQDEDGRQQRRKSTTHRCSEDENTPCKHHTDGVVVIAFNTKNERTVHRGTCLGHGLHGSTVYVGLDTKSGELVAISEWVLKWRKARKASTKPAEDQRDTERDEYMKQVLSIEREMCGLLKLNHRHLLHYLAFTYKEEVGKINIYVLIEYSGGQNLEIYLTRKTLTFELLHGYTLELLEAVKYLHEKDVVHKNLRASSVFIDVHGRVRLADYSINKRLCDLYTTVEESRPGVKFTDNSSQTSRGNKKGDIYQLGLLLLSLAEGSSCDELLPVVPSNLPDVFRDFLSKCLHRDDKVRWSCTQLLDHPFCREQIQPIIHCQANVPEKTQKAKKDNSMDESEEDGEEFLPFLTDFERNKLSRLTNEFNVLKLLGKGGFGDVLKVKNKLDGRMYAMKRITLNPKSQHFNRKITREVKLLSRLNHENVVRYYNSWIETTDEPALSDTSSSFSGTPKDSASEKKVSLPANFCKNSLEIMGDIENFGPQIEGPSGEFSISYEYSKSHVCKDDDGNDSDGSDDDSMQGGNVFALSFMDEKSDSSLGIVFEQEFEDATTALPEIESHEKKVPEKDEPELKKQYLYIQMEYCEKSTLRNCIDAGLYQDPARMWRLFREIVEGLVHIHEQGMIHRDLKPVNIFLDSNDHVKIGDFGLATSDILSKASIKENALVLTSAGDIHDYSSRSGSLGDGNLTGRVGTALYVSPEMMMQHSKVTYSQKVDIYSLGIIFFEMCYKPLDTNMERVKVLGHLRTKDVIFPEDFDTVGKQLKIVQWLLNHDPNERPTSKELLQSEYMPPPQMEEEELNEVLRSTISDPQSKSYHRMMNVLFSQTVSLADDHVYDSDLYKGSFSIKMSLTQGLVHDTLMRIFQKHGAVRLSTALLVPRQKLYDHTEHYTCLMDHSGRLVGLPFDLRLPFARYVSRTNVNYLKRYCFDKVYRKRKVGGFHPRELTECAFDIFTNSVSLIPDGEVIVVVQDIINEFPPLQQRNYYVKLHHTSLVSAVLLHFGLPENKHAEFLKALTEIKRDSKSSLSSLTTFNLSEQVLHQMLNHLETEGTYQKVANVLRTITKSRGQAATLAKQGLHELEAVITNAEQLGLKLPISVRVYDSLTTLMYRGVTFQVTIDIKRKKKTVSEVLATGGRYDHLVEQYDARRGKPASKKSAVGVSIAFEKIVSAMLEMEEFEPPSAYDILVCTIGHRPMLKERMGLVRDMWKAGLKAEILHETLEGQEEIQDFCRAQGISHLVILKDTDGSNVKVRTIEKEKITEKILPISQLVEHLKQRLQTNTVEWEPKTVSQSTSNKPVSNYTIPQENQPQTTVPGGNIAVNFEFIMESNIKPASNTRKRHEAQIVSKVTLCFPWLTAKCMEVIALEMPVSAMKVLIAYLDVDTTEQAFETSISAVAEKLARYKKYLSKITDKIHQLVFKNKCTCIVMYSMKDERVKLLTSS